MSRGRCDICECEFAFRWTDTHGIGACLSCGAPYRVYHHEGNTRVEKPPALCIRDEWVPLTKRYWQEKHRNCDPGAYNFRGSSYEVASREDFTVYRDWMEAHRDEFPPEPEAEPDALAARAQGDAE